MRRIGAAFALCGLPFVCAAAPRTQALAQSVSATANAAIQTKQSGGMAVAIVNRNSIVSFAAFGNATAQTPFSIGSVSKMFTAAGIFELAEQGRLSIDDPAGKYLPEYPVLKTISIRSLLEHTAGLPNYLDDAEMSGDITTQTTPDAILSSALRGPLDFKPGSDWNYSNTNYVVLGRIIERASGLPLAEYEKRHIFEPLHLQHTFAAPPVSANAAAPFGARPGDFSWYYACGDVFSSASDLARFDIALMQGRLLRKKTFALMQQTAPFPTLAPGMRDGLGVFVTDIGNEKLVGHHGGEPGYRADNEMIPDRGFAVVIVGSGSYNTAPILRAALTAYFPQANFTAAPAYVDGDPAVTSHITALLEDLANGHADREQFAPLAATGIDALASDLKSRGTLGGLRFVNKLYTSIGKVYTYRALFTGKAATLVVLVDRDGKIGSLYLVP